MSTKLLKDRIRHLREVLHLSSLGYSGYTLSYPDILKNTVSELEVVEKQLEAYEKALHTIIDWEDCDPVQVAHTAITPYTEWKAVSKEEEEPLVPFWRDIADDPEGF